MNEWIPILSLVVAVAAVIIGPFVSWQIAKRQIDSAFSSANKQVIAPMRQEWINSLRDMLAEITSTALHYFVAGSDDRTDEEYQRIEFLGTKITLMLNLHEADHAELVQKLGDMVETLHGDTPEARGAFQNAHKAVMKLSGEILKREWRVVKEEWPRHDS